MQWAKDGQAVAQAYAALSRLTGSGNAERLQKAVDGASKEIAGAAQLTVNPRVSSALDVLSKAVVHIKESRGIEAFVEAMEGVPQALLDTLEHDARPDYFTTVYQQYDLQVARSRKLAVEGQIVDAVATMDKTATRLGVVLHVANRSDPYLATFSNRYGTPTVAAKGLEARSKLITALKNLDAESRDLLATRSRTPTAKEDLADLREAVQVIKAIAHPEPASQPSATTK
jgi:hypothetical protein